MKYLVQYIIKYALLTVILTFSFSTSASFSQNFPAPRSPYINDFADLIDAETEARITKDLLDLLQQRGIEMTVVTIERRDDYGTGTTLENFTTGLFNTWGIGNATANNGILFLVARGDRETRIELGSGFGPEYDDRMKLVVDHTIIPFFRQNEFAKGIDSGVLEIIKRTDAEFIDPTSKSDSWLKQVNDKILFVLAAAATLVLGLRRRAADTVARWRKCPQCGRRTLSIARQITQTPSKTVKGQEEHLLNCGNCDF